jgi:hypothetical protein
MEVFTLDMAATQAIRVMALSPLKGSYYPP